MKSDVTEKAQRAFLNDLRLNRFPFVGYRKWLFVLQRLEVERDATLSWGKHLPGSYVDLCYAGHDVKIMR